MLLGKLSDLSLCFVGLLGRGEERRGEERRV